MRLVGKRRMGGGEVDTQAPWAAHWARRRHGALGFERQEEKRDAASCERHMLRGAALARELQRSARHLTQMLRRGLLRRIKCGKLPSPLRLGARALGQLRPHTPNLCSARHLPHEERTRVLVRGDRGQIGAPPALRSPPAMVASPSPDLAAAVSKRAAARPAPSTQHFCAGGDNSGAAAGEMRTCRDQGCR